MNKHATKKLDPVTGPLSREEFRALVNAPYGDAIAAIRQHDPLYGLPEGAEIEWEVTFEREATQEGYATVKAASKEEAIRKADKLKYSEIEWDDDFQDTGTITDVTPCPPVIRRR